MVHTFCPLSTHSSPSRSPRVASDARSEPAPGSLSSWHHFSSLRTSGGRKRSRCSSVPNANSAGAALFKPSGFRRPRLNGASTASTICACAGARSSPPYATGQVATASPLSANVRVPGLVRRRGCAPSGSRRAHPSRRGVAPRGRHVLLDPTRDHRADLVVGRRPVQPQAGRVVHVEYCTCGRTPRRPVAAAAAEAKTWPNDGAEQRRRHHRRGSRTPPRPHRRRAAAPAAAALPLPERGRVPPRRRGVRRRQPALVRSRVRGAERAGAARSVRPTSTVATRSSARTRSTHLDDDTKALLKGDPLGGVHAFYSGQLPRVVGAAAPGHARHSPQRARRRARQAERVRRARGARVDRRGVRRARSRRRCCARSTG